MVYDKLKLLAETAKNSTTDYYHDLKVFDVEAIDDFAMEANPDEILNLISSHEALHKENGNWKSLHQTNELCVNNQYVEIAFLKNQLVKIRDDIESALLNDEPSWSELKDISDAIFNSYWFIKNLEKK